MDLQTCEDVYDEATLEGNSTKPEVNGDTINTKGKNHESLDVEELEEVKDSATGNCKLVDENINKIDNNIDNQSESVDMKQVDKNDIKEKKIHLNEECCDKENVFENDIDEEEEKISKTVSENHCNENGNENESELYDRISMKNQNCSLIESMENVEKRFEESQPNQIGINTGSEIDPCSVSHYTLNSILEEMENNFEINKKELNLSSEITNINPELTENQEKIPLENSNMIQESTGNKDDLPLETSNVVQESVENIEDTYLETISMVQESVEKKEVEPLEITNDVQELVENKKDGPLETTSVIEKSCENKDTSLEIKDDVQETVEKKEMMPLEIISDVQELTENKQNMPLEAKSIIQESDENKQHISLEQMNEIQESAQKMGVTPLAIIDAIQESVENEEDTSLRRTNNVEKLVENQENTNLDTTSFIQESANNKLDKPLKTTSIIQESFDNKEDTFLEGAKDVKKSLENQEEASSETISVAKESVKNEDLIPFEITNITKESIENEDASLVATKVIQESIENVEDIIDEEDSGDKATDNRVSSSQNDEENNLLYNENSRDVEVEMCFVYPGKEPKTDLSNALTNNENEIIETETKSDKRLQEKSSKITEPTSPLFTMLRESTKVHTLATTLSFVEEIKEPESNGEKKEEIFTKEIEKNYLQKEYEVVSKEINKTNKKNKVNEANNGTKCGLSMSKSLNSNDSKLIKVNQITNQEKNSTKPKTYKTRQSMGNIKTQKKVTVPLKRTSVDLGVLSNKSDTESNLQSIQKVEKSKKVNDKNKKFTKSPLSKSYSESALKKNDKDSLKKLHSNQSCEAMNIVQYDRPFQTLNEGLMKTELVYESQISQTNFITSSSEMILNKVENTEVESNQVETLENENKDIDNTDNISKILITSSEQTATNDQEIKALESAEGLESQINDNQTDVGENIVNADGIKCSIEDEESKTHETADFVDGNSELSESINLNTEHFLNQVETKLNSNENEKSTKDLTENNNNDELEKDLIKLEVIPAKEALTEDVAAETNKTEGVIEENIATTENVKSIDERDVDPDSECNEALKGEQSQPDSSLDVQSAKYDDKNILLDVSPSLVEKENDSDGIREDKKNDIEAEIINESVADTRPLISKELETKEDEEKEKENFNEHAEPNSQTTETENRSENLNLNETGVNQLSEVTEVKKETFIEELLLLDQNSTENISSDNVVEESTYDKGNEEDKLENKIENITTEHLSQNVQSSENHSEDQVTVLNENNETINSLSNKPIPDLHHETEQLETEISDSCNIREFHDKAVINEENEKTPNNDTNENVLPLYEGNKKCSESDDTEGLDISNASAIACSIVKDIVDGILAKRYIEEDISSIIIVRNIIDNIIEKALSPKQTDDYRDSKKQEEIPDSNQSYENESRIENKEFVSLDENISEDKNETVENNKRRKTSETLECVSEYGSSSKTESTLDAKVEGKKMTIVERPKAKERKISVTSKKSVPSPDLSSAPRRKSSIFESEQQKNSNKIGESKSILNKEIKRSDKRMSLDLGAKERKYSLSRKASEMALDKGTRRASSSQIVSKNPDIDKSTVKVIEKEIKLEDDKSIKNDTETHEEIKEEKINENDSGEFYNPIIDLNEEKSSSLAERMEINDAQPYDVEIEVQADETTEEIQAECKDEIDGVKSSDSERTDIIMKDQIKNQTTEKPILTNDKKFDDKRFEETLKSLRRLSLNQPNSSEELITSKERSVSVVTKSRPLRKCSTLKELSLEKSEPKIESQEKVNEYQESINILDDQSKENDQTVTENADKNKKINLNTFDEEKQNEENEIKSHLENKSTHDELVEDRQDIENRNDEHNIPETNNMMISCEGVKEMDNPYELTETTKESKEPETKSQVSSAHTITIEVKDELSEIREEQDQPQKDGIWIIDNWECNPEMKLEDEIDHEDERISKEDSTDKPKDKNSKAINTEDIKVELRKKLKTSNYNATPVEKYLTKSANEEKVEKSTTKEKTPASKYIPKPKEKPDEKVIVEVNGKTLKSTEKPKESKQPILQRKKLKELTFDNIGKKKRKTNEDDKTNKNSFPTSNDLELRRIKSNIETLKIEIKKNKQEPKDHVPFIYNDLHPYGDTNMYENFRVKKPMSATGAISRMTAIDLCEPWESFEMDKLILPPIRFPSANTDSKRQNLSRISYRREKSAIDAKLSHRSDVLKNHSLKERSKSSLQTKRRSELHEKKPKLSSRRIDDDYQKTKSDLYRLSLDKYDSVTSARSRSNIRKALFAYLQNSPGSRKALYEVIHNIDQKG